MDHSDEYTPTNFGTPVDDSHSLKAGVRGPTVLEDLALRTKITRFDQREFQSVLVCLHPYSGM